MNAQQGAGAVEPAKPVVQKGRPVVRRPDVDTLFSVNPDGSRNAIHPADVAGRFQRRKRALWLLLVAIYLAVPWLKVGGHPALLIDIPHRHFYLFGQTFNAQDFWLAFFLVTGVGFALFMAAALFGRVWCGYACPQTVFLEGVFRRVERWIEGPPAARRGRDGAAPRREAVRRGVEVAAFLAISAVVAPGLLFVNFTWFREQLCIVVCPYGRLQGALYDQDTLLVGYDARRGEPRGPAGTDGAGACVDCYRCVSVCPTGIDIRNGPQLECVGCANCVDACDDVMAKLGREPGLVRHDSQRGFAGQGRRFVRGRVFLYAALLAVGVGALSLALTRRRPFEAMLLRGPGRPYVVESGRVHNTFDLQLINKRPGRREFAVAVAGTAGETVVTTGPLELDALEVRKVPVHVFVPLPEFKAGLKAELTITCREEGGDLVRLATAPLLGPSPPPR